MIDGSISGIAWFVVFLLSQISVFHSYRIKNKSAVIIKLFLSSMVGCVFSNLFLCKSMMEMLIGLIVMVSFFVLYMPFYYTISSSISVQTLILLSEKDSQTCSVDELKNTFASPKIVSYKLKSMENSDIIQSNGKAYKITLKGKLIAKSFRLIKRLWKLGPGG